MRPQNPAIRTVLSIYHAARWLLLLPWYGFFNAAVLERLRMVVGGSFKGSVSGGGALPTAVDRFFNYLGIPVLEGYGLTETSPVLAVRTPGKLVIGTVGPLLADTEVRIVDPENNAILYPDSTVPDLGCGRQGEIQVKGPQVMKGYYHNDSATEQAFSEGWFRTGDLGLVTWNHCLKIVGRCKDTIVLSSGENVEPLPIENTLQQSALIEHIMLVGQDKKFIGALIVPAKDTTADLDQETLHQALAAELRTKISPARGYKKIRVDPRFPRSARDLHRRQRINQPAEIAPQCHCQTIRPLDRGNVSWTLIVNYSTPAIRPCWP
ncbi:MAG: AMP-binding protein [Verrucomicrobia bacterium]|nr:AMP-binding protein [Verrucomicrobiota bacterium]